MRVRVALLLAAAMNAYPGAAPAQTPADLFQQGVRAYQRLEFDDAAVLFRRSLDLGTRDTAGPRDRSRAFDYLAASLLFSGNRDSASATFRNLLIADALHRIDDLIFPPEVSGLLDDVRRTTKAVTLVAAVDTAVRLGTGAWSARLVVTSFHDVAVALVAGDVVVWRLYSGPIGDSLTVRWDGRDSTGAAARPGAYSLTVTSRVGGRTVRALRIPLDVQVTRRDTLPTPSPLADSLLLPERLGAGQATRSLLGGLWIGGAVAVMPLVMARGVRPTPARFVVGGAVGLAGLAGYFAKRPGRPIPANIVANRVRRDAWGAQVQAVARENAERRADTIVRIRSGTPVVSGSGTT